MSEQEELKQQIKAVLHALEESHMEALRQIENARRVLSVARLHHYTDHDGRCCAMEATVAVKQALAALHKRKRNERPTRPLDG